MKKNFLIGIIFVILGTVIMFYFVKDRTLSCSKITSKCSIETKNFMGQKENIAEYNLKTIKRAELVTSENYRRRSSNLSRHNHSHSHLSVTVGGHTVSNGTSHYEYHYTYKPVLITEKGKNIEFANSLGFSRMTKISKQEVLNKAEESEYGKIVREFNAFLTSPTQQNYTYEVKADSAKIILYVLMAVGAILIFI